MSRDVLVVGGGAIGVCCALELARHGATVTLLEAGADVGAGCSAGNAGLLCPSHAAPIATRSALLQGVRWSIDRDAPFALRPHRSLLPWILHFAAACTPSRERRSTDLLRGLSQASLELVEGLRDEVGVAVERSGTLNVYETEDEFGHARHEAVIHRAAGLRSELLSPSEAVELEPALQTPIAGAILYPDELSGDPLDFVHTVGRAAAAAGVDIRTETEVLALRADRGRIVAVETTEGRIAAETVVLATGAWTGRLLRGVGLALPLASGKGYHVDYERHGDDPGLPVFLHASRVVVTPLPGRLRLAGTFELTGVDLSIDQRRVDAVARAGSQGVRGLQGRAVREVWRGLRPCTPDGLPIVGRTARYENLVLATGHAMLGFTLAPVTGRLVAQLIAGEEPDHPLAPLSPERFRRLIRRTAPRA